MRTIVDAEEDEPPRTKGSRFIGYASPVEDLASYNAFVDAIRALHRKSTHVASAGVLANGETRSSDDGEPSGTAGAPILARIQGLDLTGVGVAVVRYYGGTNLGKGGLVRAYGGAAAAVLARCGVVEVAAISTLAFEVPTAVGNACRVAVERQGLTVVEIVYGVSGVRFAVEGPPEDVELIRPVLVEASKGAVRWAEDS